MKIRVLLADDHQVVRQGLRSLLEKEGFEVVGEASDGRGAVRLAQDLHPDVVVLDLAMPSLNGLEAAREMASALPHTRTVLLTMHSESHFVLEALRAGVNGYVLKSRAADELITAIRHVFEQKTYYLSPAVSQYVVAAYLAAPGPEPDPLTPRERQVLQLVAEGKTNKEVADILGITVRTAESHRATIMEKLDLHDTAGLVRFAIRRGLIQPVVVAAFLVSPAVLFVVKNWVLTG